MERAEKTKKILINLGIAVFLLILFFLISKTITKITGFSILEEDNNIKCEDSEAILVINSQNPYVELKRINVKNYLDKVKIKNCFKDKDYCVKNEITFFPTWIIGDKKFEKNLNDKELLNIIDCKI